MGMVQPERPRVWRIRDAGQAMESSSSQNYCLQFVCLSPSAPPNVIPPPVLMLAVQPLHSAASYCCQQAGTLLTLPHSATDSFSSNLPHIFYLPSSHLKFEQLLRAFSQVVR